MSEKMIKRKLIAVDYDTGGKGRLAELQIGPSLICIDTRTGDDITEEINGSYWHPLDIHELPIDGIIHINIVAGIWSVTATTSMRIKTHPEFVWLRSLAKNLQAEGIRYTPFLRKDVFGHHLIIDTVRLPRL